MNEERTTIEVTIIFSFPALVFGQLVSRLSYSLWVIACYCYAGGGGDAKIIMNFRVFLSPNIELIFVHESTRIFIDIYLIILSTLFNYVILTFFEFHFWTFCLPFDWSRNQNLEFKKADILIKIRHHQVHNYKMHKLLHRLLFKNSLSKR